MNNRRFEPKEFPFPPPRPFFSPFAPCSPRFHLQAEAAKTPTVKYRTARATRMTRTPTLRRTPMHSCT